MQGLKWKLSFNTSRPSRQLKRFWLDSNVRATDNEMDFTRGKLLLVFLDTVLSNQDQQAMRSVVDELLEDIVPICSSLLHWLKLCEMKSSSALAVSTDEAPLLVDIQAKILIVAEMLMSTKGTKSSFRESIATTNPCIRYAVEALKAVDEVTQKLGMVRILRNIVFTEAHLLELGNLGGFRVLAEVTRASNSPALTTQVVHLHRLYLEFIQSAKLVQMLSNDPSAAYRTRAVSSSSTGSAPAGNLLSTTPRGTGLASSHSKHFNNSSPSIGSSSHALHYQHHAHLHSSSPLLNTSALHNNSTLPLNDTDSVDDSSIAAKGLNIAFNFVNELLKLAPISSEWLNGTGRKDKDSAMVDSLGVYLEEQTQVSAMLLASSVLDIETERVRAVEKCSEQQLPDVVTEGEQLEDERSRLYPRKPLSPLNTHGKAMSPQSWTYSDNETPGMDVDRTSASASPTPRSPHHAGKDPIWLPHLVDPLDHIRSQMADQDMLSVLLLAMEKAASPTDALEVLLAVQAMLLNDSTAQSSFLATNGYACLSAMLLRVEENLVLLVPCSDVSMAAASGQQQHRMSLGSVASSVSSGSGMLGPGPPSPGKISSYGVGVSIDDHSRRSERGGGSFSFLNHGEQMGLYSTFAKGEFDAYYSQLVMVLLNIILDDTAVQQLSSGNNLPFLPPRGGEIKNFKAVSILVSLLASARVGLNTVVLRVSYALMRLHAPNVAVLEVLSVVSSLVEKLMAISYGGTLDVAALSKASLSAHNTDPRILDSLSGEMTGEGRPSQGNLDGTSDSQSDCGEEEGGPPKPCPQYPPDVLCTVASEVVVLLQIVSVCTANRDNSVAAFLAMLLQTSPVAAGGDGGGVSSPRESGGLDSRCQNCEMELACLQCLNEGCMHDKSALLCQECDNVFHKSAVKKSHIRLPVLSSSTAGSLRSPLTPSASTSKLSISRENSATITQQLEGVLEMGGPTCPYRALTALIQELSEFCKAPLLKHCMVDPLTGRVSLWGISSHGGDGMAVQVLQECLQCVLLAGLRGILDDREVRGIDRSTALFPSLLVTLRTTVCSPFVSATTLGQEDIVDVYRREALFMSEQLRLSELLDSRQDVMHPAPDHRTATGEFIQQPPEVSHTSPRRIQLVLLSQCISRFLLPSCRIDAVPSLFARKDDNYRDMRALFQQHVETPLQESRTKASMNSLQSELIHQAMLFGTDALLVHLLLDSSLHTQLAAVDRQFIIWLLREFAISASSYRSEHADRIFLWFQWIIRGNVAGKRLHSDAGRTRQKLLLKPSLTKNNNPMRPLKSLLGGQLRSEVYVTTSATKVTLTITAKEVFATIPSTAPTIGLPIRLLAVQELRLILGTHCQSLPGCISSSPTSLQDSCSLIRLAQIPLTLSPQSPTFESPGVYGSVGGSQHPRRGMASVHSASAWGGGVSVAYHSTLATLPLRKHLISAGFIETLLDILLGELCSPSIYRLLRESPSQPAARASTGDDRDQRGVTELEKEDWWGAFATLGALLTGCDEAKDRLHEHTGVDAMVKFLMEQLEFVTRSGGSLNSTVDHHSVLNTLLIELCIKREQFAPPSKPFHAAVARIPQHAHPPSWGMEDTGLSADAAGKEQNRLSALYVRGSTSKYAPSFDSSGVPPTGKRAASTIMGADGTKIVSPIALSPVYFAQDRTCLQIRYCCRPCPLALTSERFRKAFAAIGSVPPAGPIQPLKYHLPVSRSSFKSADYSELRSRLSTDGDINVHTSSGIVSSNSSAVLLSRKLMMRRNISTASVHSVESDNRWEVDSVGLTPSALGDGTGRGSFHSAHSLAALSQALTSQVGTPAASVSGDVPQSAHTHHSKPSLQSQYGRIAWEQSHPGELLGKSDNQEHLQALLRAPFPPMTQCASGSVPGVYVPLLKSSDSADLESYSTHMLMLLHHALLVRGGYSESVVPAELLDSPMRDEDHTQCHSRQISEDPLNNFDLPSGSRMSLLSMESAHGSTAAVPVDLPSDIQDRETAVECNLVLRKHLSTFIVPFVSPELASVMEAETAHHPAFSRIQLRSPECCELLLATAIVSSSVNQLFMFSMLSRMLDGNPANAHAFVSKPTTCVTLTRLITVLREEAQEKVGYLLSQVLRYSLQQPVLRDLLDVVKRTRSMSGEILESSSITTCSAVVGVGADDVGLEVDSKSLLFVMGRTAERIAPENFLHFDQESPFCSYVELPHITVPYGTATPAEITVCSWVRIGTLSNAPSSAFLQIHSPTSDLLINTFFRVVYKLSSPKSKDSNEVPSAGTARLNAQPGSQRITKRVVQLCISFGKSVATSSNNFENGCAMDALDPQAASSLELSTIFGQKYPVTSLPVSSTAAVGAATTSTGGAPASDPVVDTTAQSVRAAHWTLAVESLCGIHRDYETNEETTQQHSEGSELNSAALTLANCLSHIAVPDAIVELDWSEMGDWHLLALGLSAGRLTCSADGVALPILHWTPLGYQYDERSVEIKSAAESCNLKSLPTVHSCAAEEVPVSVGLHHVNIAAGLPFHVTLGGLKYESPAYDTVCIHISRPESSESPSTPGLGLLSLVQAVDHSIRGFSGSMGEVAVLSGTVEEARLRAWAREGPSNGFRDLKTARLTGLNATALRVPETSSFAHKGEPASSLSFPAFLGTAPVELAPVTEEVLPYNVFLTSGVPALKEKDELFGKSRLAKEKEGSVVKFSRTVQIHQTTALVGAFSKVGGIKALYPLMTADKSRMVAALRILASLISHSKESYQEFRTVEADKVLLYCAVQNSALVTLETLQVLFELIIEPGASTATASSMSAVAMHPGSTIGHSTEAIYRVALLELLVDLVLALPQNSQLARGAIDWLREVCDDNLSNCQKVLRSPGLLPVLVLLSSWDLPGCEQLPRSASLLHKTSSEKISTSAAETAGSSRDPSAAQALKVRRDRSLSMGSAPEKSLLSAGNNRAKQVVDISRAAPAAVSVPVNNLPGEGSNISSSDRDDGRLRLMDRVNKEFTQKVLTEEKEAAETLAIYAERYKMQLSCARYIKLLMSGTSGEVAHGSLGTASAITMMSTGTDFSSQHVGMLLSFALVCSSKHSSDEEGGSRLRNTDYVRDRERRQRAARLKRVIYGSFSGIPILRQMDIATPAYWLCSSALVALDALIDATNSALQAQVVSLLKAAFAGTTLQSMMLQLMGSECAEIRERGLRILLLSFSTLDGKLDVKQVSYFDRMHGFQCLAEQLSAQRDGCSDLILQWVLSLIFWQRHHRRISSSSAGGSDGADRRSSVSSIASTSADEEEGFYPIRPSPSTSRPTSWEISRQTQSSTVTTVLPVSTTPAMSVSAQECTPSTTDLDTGNSNNKQANESSQEPTGSHGASPASKTAVVGGGPAAPNSAGVSQSVTATAASGSIMSSLFSWSSTNNSSAVPSKPPISHSTVDGIASRDAKHRDSSTAGASDQGELGKGAADPATSSVPAAALMPASVQAETMKQLPLSPREPSLAEIRVNHIDELRSAQMHRRSEVEVMEVPQALEVLFRVLQSSSSPDQVTHTFRVIEQSISTTLSGVSNSSSTELSAAVNQLHLRNAESFFTQKDWLVSLCDLLVQYRRQALNTDERDCGASVFSLSENESIGPSGYYGGGAFDPYGSGDESENNSVGGDISLGEDRDHAHRGAYRSSVGSADSCSGRISAWHQHLIDQFSNPIYSLIRRLLLQDMAAGRVGSARRWNELFRLSLPELYSIQEHLLLDLVGCMSNLSEFCDDVHSSVNMLKNIAAVLEQALEKADMTLMFNVKVVTALHSLSYNCSPEVRAKIKETNLPEMRKQYVVRCLLDNTQDYYTKVAAISEISSPLLGYISTTESKLLSDTNVVMMVLGMMVEACEDLEFLLGGVDSTAAVLNDSVHHLDSSAGERPRHLSNADEFRLVGSPIPATAFDRVHVLFEVMEVLLETVQNCTISSPECKRCVSKLVANMPGDPKGYLLDALLNTFGAKVQVSQPETPRRKGSGNSTAGEVEVRVETEGGGKGAVLSRGNSLTGAAGSSSAQQPVSYTWWGGWYSGETTNEDPSATPSAHTTKPTTVAAPATITVADLETGKMNVGSDSEPVAAAMQSPDSPIDAPTPAGAQELAAMNMKTFIAWFCSPDQRELQARFRAKVLTEVRLTHRVFDKLREKNTQRYMRYTRSAQEKRAREKSYSSKTVKDALLLCKATSDKVTGKFQKDTKSWVSGLNDRIEAGKGHFHSSLEDRLAHSKSPLKDPKLSSPPQSCPVQIHLSEPLRAYLQQHQQASPGRLSGLSPSSLDHSSNGSGSHNTVSRASTTTTTNPRSSTSTATPSSGKVPEVAAAAVGTAGSSSAGRAHPAGYDAGAALSDLLVAFH